MPNSLSWPINFLNVFVIHHVTMSLRCRSPRTVISLSTFASAWDGKSARLLNYVGRWIWAELVMTHPRLEHTGNDNLISQLIKFRDSARFIKCSIRRRIYSLKRSMRRRDQTLWSRLEARARCWCESLVLISRKHHHHHRRAGSHVALIYS